MIQIKYEISKICKECIKRQIDKKGAFKIKCTPIPKELADVDKPYYPLDKIIGKDKYLMLPDETKADLLLRYDKLLWAKQALNWSTYNADRSYEQFYQKETLLCTAKLRAVRMGRRMGKCVEENSLVVTWNRGLVKAKELQQSDTLITYDENHGILSKTKDFLIENNGVQECIKIITNSGKEDVVTTNHPYYSLRGNDFQWTNAEDLTENDKILVSSSYLDLSNTHYFKSIYGGMEDEHYRLGYYSEKNNNIDQEVYSLEPSEIYEFLRGVFRDQNVTINGNNIFKHKSIIFLEQIKHLLLRIGIQSKLDKSEKKLTLICYSDKITDIEKIEKVEKVGKRNTYSISVGGTHTFITNDIITHNSESLIIDAIHYATNNQGVNVLVIGPFQNLIDEIFDRIDKLLSSDNSIYKGQYSRSRRPFHKIEFKNGSSLKGFTTGTDADSIRGQSADIVFFDEAAYIPPLAYRTILAFLMDKPNVKIMATSTPSQIETNFKKWCTEDASWRDFWYPSTILPYFSELEPILRGSYTGDDYDLEVKAEFVEGSAKVFKTDDIIAASEEYSYINSRKELPYADSWQISIGEHCAVHIRLTA